jgi:CubicO group peptidase (beta-lactamase class C family)
MTMSSIILPTEQEVREVVENQTKLHEHNGFAIGVASPQFTAPKFYFAGNLLDYNQKPMKPTRDTPFELASNSKIFTASLLAYYAQQNPNLLTAQVSTYTPPGMEPLPDSFNGITLLNLSNYTSGLPQDNENPTDEPTYLPQPYTEASMYGYLHDGNVPVIGTGTTYAFSLLACLTPVAVQSSQSFSELLKQTITEPLGMHRTRPFTEVSITKLPLGMQSGQPQSSGWPEFPAYIGGGGLVSTCHDMMIWLEFHMGMLSSNLNNILSSMQTPSTTVAPWDGTQLGMGWFITSIPATDNGEPVFLPVLWKDGGLVGCSTFVTFLQSPEPGITPSQAGVFVLTNDTLPNDGQQIAFNILRRMNGYS